MVQEYACGYTTLNTPVHSQAKLETGQEITREYQVPQYFSFYRSQGSTWKDQVLGYIGILNNR